MLKLQTLRKNIDSIDEHIILLLKERMDVVRRIGKLKKEQGLPFRDDKRWKESLEKKISKAKESGIDPALIKKIYESVHRHALGIEQDA